MTPKELLRRLGALPTILGFQHELDAIEEARRFSIAEIRHDLPSFIAILARIQESHSDNGIFEMDEASEEVVHEFHGWIGSIEKDVDAHLMAYVDGLELSCADIRRLMPKG